jgi:hypothetical protein
MAVQLNINVSNKRLQINLVTDHFKSNLHLTNEYLRLVERADPEYKYIPDGELLVDPVEELHDWALRPFLTLFCQILPLDLNRENTLRDCFYPETFKYTIQSEEDNLIPTLCDNAPAQTHRSIRAMLSA